MAQSREVVISMTEASARYAPNPEEPTTHEYDEVALDEPHPSTSTSNSYEEVYYGEAEAAAPGLHVPATLAQPETPDFRPTTITSAADLSALAEDAQFFRYVEASRGFAPTAAPRQTRDNRAAVLQDIASRVSERLIGFEESALAPLLEHLCREQAQFGARLKALNTDVRKANRRLDALEKFQRDHDRYISYLLVGVTAFTLLSGIAVIVILSVKA